MLTWIARGPLLPTWEGAGSSRGCKGWRCQSSWSRSLGIWMLTQWPCRGSPRSLAGSAGCENSCHGDSSTIMYRNFIHTLQISLDNLSISLVKFLASKGEQSRMLGSMGGRYHGMHSALGPRFDRVSSMWHSSTQEAWGELYDTSPKPAYSHLDLHKSTFVATSVDIHSQSSNSYFQVILILCLGLVLSLWLQDWPHSEKPEAWSV